MSSGATLRGTSLPRSSLRALLLSPLRRALLALTLAAATLAAGCGKGTTGDEATLRFANVVASGATLDLYRDTGKIHGSVAAGSVSAYDSVAVASTTWSLRSEGGSSSLASATIALDADASYTVLGYGSDGSLKTQLFKEEDSAPDSGYVKLRVFNAAPDAGTLDVFVSDDGQDVSSASTTVASAGYGTVTGFATIASGTRRLRVTANGDRTDLRLDLHNVTLTNQAVITLVIAPSGGGVLVDALLLPEKAAATKLANTQARVRVASGLSANATASVTWGSTSVASSLRAPSVNAYTLVDAGTATLAVTVNGASANSGSATLAAGGDYTLLLTGAAGASSAGVLTDDNRLPSASTRSKMRLVNGVTGLSDTLTLAVDYNAVAAGIASGIASSYASVTPPSSGRIEVTAPTLATPLYLNTDVTLTAEAVYTVFVLGEAASPSTVIRKDR